MSSFRIWRPGGPNGCRTLPDTAYFALAPDWLCDILSPATAAIDRTKKLPIYARERVAHVWLVDPIACTLGVLRLENDRWVVAETHAGDQIVRAQPFDRLELDLGALWADHAPAEG